MTEKGHLTWSNILYWSVGVFFLLSVVLIGRASLSKLLLNLGQIQYIKLFLADEKGPSLTDLSVAQASFRNALKVDPQNYRAWRMYGYVILQEDHPAEALAAWQKVAGIEQELLAWGMKSFVMRQDQEALQWYRLVGVLNPNSAYPPYYTGLVYERQEAWSNASAAFLYAQKKTNSQEISSSLDFHLGRYHRLGLTPPDFGTALRLFETALEANNFVEEWERVDTHFHRGDVLRHLGREAEAVQEFQYVVQEQPLHYRALVLLGETNWQLSGNLGEAERYLQLAIAADPNQVWAYKRLAQIYLEAEESDQASALYRQVLDIDPSDQTALHYLKNDD